MGDVTVKQILDFVQNNLMLSSQTRFINCDDVGDVSLYGAAPLPVAQAGQISLCRDGFRGVHDAMKESNASLLLIDKAISLPEDHQTPSIICDNARLVFMHLLKEFFVTKYDPSIHETAIIDPSVKIGKDVYIGPYVTIAKNSVIGDNCSLHAGVNIYDSVVMGRNCIIHSGCVLGADGFGFEQIENPAEGQEPVVKFEHIGSVELGDFVEIQALTNVARGALGVTKIGNYSKIDVNCHVGHNVQIGENCLITSGAMLGGSVVIKNNVYIAPCVSIINKVIVHDHAFIGMSSFVRKDVEPHQCVVGSPARPFERKN